MDFNNKENLDDKDKAELAKSYILEKMLNPDKGEIEDFVPTLHFLAENNPKITRKVGRNYLAKISEMTNTTWDDSEMTKVLDDLAIFVKWPDELKPKRIEWVLGYPQVAAFMNNRVDVLEFGSYKLGGKNGPYSDRSYYKFKSSCCGLHSEAYLGLVNHYCTRSKNEKNNNYLLGAKLLEKLGELMIHDEHIREYVRSMPHSSLRFPTFMQSFVPTL